MFKKKYLIITLVAMAVATITAVIFDKDPIKRGIIDCHSDPNMDCYGVYQDGNKGSYYLRVLRHYYLNRQDSIRPVPEYQKFGLITEEDEIMLNGIMDQSLGVKIKNHSIIKYKERSVGAYTVVIDSIDKEIIIHPKLVKPINDK